MSKSIVLNLGKGNLQQGFPTVIAQLWQTDSPTPMQFSGELPADPKLEGLYQRWQLLYEALYASLSWRGVRNSEFEIEEDTITHISKAEFEKLSQELQQSINAWLSGLQFLNIDRKLRTQLVPTDEIRFIITSESPQVLKLPWCLWHFFTDYPRSEIALSPPEYARSIKADSTKSKDKVRILAILGDSQRIDVDKDQQLLKLVPKTELKFLVEPNRSELTEQLWESGWDILFFAGHSSSLGKGRLQLNPTETLTIDQLRYALLKAIAQGLKLAIFNSCDGLGLAQDLADLHLPQVIVMREPVPDRVAQEFLKHFLTAFSDGQTLYAAVREAREKLQSLENDFPCATWLPVICQNPAEIPPTWEGLCGHRVGLQLPQLNFRQLPSILFSSLFITLIIVLIRSFGIFQPIDLWAFDQLMRMRAQEEPDPRLLVITINEQDIQAQGNEPRLGSLSDKHFHQLLEKLEQYQPLAIGLDLYRDFPVSARYPKLAKRMQQSKRLIVICKRPDPQSDPTGILPPPEIPPDRLGFSDFLEDRDGILRRHLLYMSPNSVSACNPAQAFSVQLAFRYLNAKGITTGFTPEGNLTLGDTVYQSLKSPTLGYEPEDTRGIQLLLNYRSSPRNIAQQVTLTQVLTGQINPDIIKNRVILIGVISATIGDYWSTPYGSGFAERTPGVFLQAQMVSQLLSAALDKRPLLWTLPLWGEVCWIWSWSLTGGVLAWYFRKTTHLRIAGVIAVLTIPGACFLILIQGGCVPLVLPVFSSAVTSCYITYIMRRIQK